MTARALRWWIVLAGLAAVLWATLDGSAAARVAAGSLCICCGLVLVRLDYLHRSRRTRR